MTLDRTTWGYRRNAVDSSYLTIHELITVLAETVSCGGNILINIGPAANETISMLQKERLRQLGDWLRVNGEAIYATKLWRYQNEAAVDVWYTSKKAGGVVNAVYAITLKWPTTGVLSLNNVTSTAETAVSMLGYTEGTFKWQDREAGGIDIFVPPIRADKMPSTWALVFKLENLELAFDET